MGRVKIIGDRSGRVWPLVLRAAQESRAAGRRLILYVPEQMTLQAERDLITGLVLPGLLDIQVISPRKLRQQVRERMGSGARKPLNEFGRAMAVHRIMAESAYKLALRMLCLKVKTAKHAFRRFRLIVLNKLIIQPCFNKI